MDVGKWNATVATTAGVVLGTTMTAFVSAAWQSPTAGDWLQFSGTLMGAGATIFAGWLALKAVYTQIDHQKAERSNELERSTQIAQMYAASLLKGANAAFDYFNREIRHGGAIDTSIHTNSEIFLETIDHLERNMVYTSEINQSTNSLDSQSIIRIRAISSAADDFLALHDLSSHISTNEINTAISRIKTAAEAAIEYFDAHSAASGFLDGRAAVSK